MLVNCAKLSAVMMCLVGCSATPARGPVAQLHEASYDPVMTNALKIGPVDMENMVPFVEGLIAAAKKGERHVTVVIDSPGGSVGIGLAVEAIMNDLREEGLSITCVVGKMAASMGAYLLQTGCTTRLMSKRSAILFHEPSMESHDNAGGHRRTAQQLDDVNQRLAIAASARLKISLAEFKRKISGRDWWLGWEEALAVGAVDGLAPGVSR